MNTHTTLNFIKKLPIKSNARILDIGSGINARSFDLLDLVPDGEIINLEIDKNKIDSIITKSLKYKQAGYTTKIQTLSFDVDNGNTLPFKDNTCDTIIISHTLRYLIYRESLLKECIRVLKPSGLIFLVELQSDAHNVATHPDMRIDIDDMFEYLERAGFLIGENFDTPHYEYGIIGICPLVDNNTIHA